MKQYFKGATFAGAILFAVGAMPGVTPDHARADYLRSASDMSKCLGVPSGENGARLRIEDCDAGGRGSQQWTYNSRTGLIVSEAFPDKCLHKATGGWARNNRIHLWSCSVGAAEMKTWRLTGSSGTINARENEEMCFRLEGNRFENGAVIGLNDDCRSTSGAIKWTMTSKDQQNCAVFDALVRPNIGLVRQMINEYLPYENEINRRKTLVTHRATTLETRGCDAWITVDATMRRKIRRDAHGTLILRANLHSISSNYICLRNPEVKQVHLSNLGMIGEGFYKRRGNRGLPDEMCVSF